MIALPYELSYDDNNPLDQVEEFLTGKGWTFTRHNATAISATLPGKQAKYALDLEWQEEFSALLVACVIPIEIKPEADPAAIEAMATINQSLWLGHFDLLHEGKFPTFRHTLLLRLVPAGIAVDLIADVIDIAMGECDRFRHTFTLIEKGDERFIDDLDAAVFETVGEA